MRHSSTFRGYTGLASEVTLNVPDMKASIDFGREKLLQEQGGFLGYNQFSCRVNGMKEAADTFYSAMEVCED